MSQETLFGEDYTTGRGQVDALERYYTPDPLAAFVLGLLPWHSWQSVPVLEPHAGGGAFIRALLDPTGAAKLSPNELTATDLDPQCWSVQQKLASVADFLDRENAPTSVRGLPFRRVIGNPPYSAIREHVERGLEIADEVAFLMPIDRLESAARLPFWDRSPLRKVWLLAERVWPGSRAIGWFWFDREHTGDAAIEVVSWKS